MKQLKKRELINFDKVDFDSGKTVKVKAKLVFDPKNVDEVRKSSERESMASTVLALNNTECEVVLNYYEKGYELDQDEEYDIIFKRENKKPYKLTVFGDVIKII